MHIKTSKSVLGVNRKATNLAVMGDSGRYQFILTCLNIVYSENVLMAHAYKESCDEHRNKTCYLG